MTLKDLGTWWNLEKAEFTLCYAIVLPGRKHYCVTVKHNREYVSTPCLQRRKCWDLQRLMRKRKVFEGLPGTYSSQEVTSTVMNSCSFGTLCYAMVLPGRISAGRILSGKTSEWALRPAFDRPEDDFQALPTRIRPKSNPEARFPAQGTIA